MNKLDMEGLNDQMRQLGMCYFYLILAETHRALLFIPPFLALKRILNPKNQKKRKTKNAEYQFFQTTLRHRILTLHP